MNKVNTIGLLPHNEVYSKNVKLRIFLNGYYCQSLSFPAEIPVESESIEELLPIFQL